MGVRLGKKVLVLKVCLESGGNLKDMWTLGSELMRNSNSILRLEANEDICEALGCFAIANEEIQIPVGSIAEISLSVCRKCKPKFVNTNQMSKRTNTK
jgi:hypothetical protein